jgi:hypothetical protein
MKKINILALSIPVLAIAFVLSMATPTITEQRTPGLEYLEFTTMPTVETNYHSLLGYNSDVCVYKNGDLVGCDHNVITNNGKDLVKFSLGRGDRPIVNHLAIGNTSAPAAGSTSHPGILSVCGMTSADGTYWSEGTGNWTIGYTWTSSCNSLNVNTTGLYNDTSAGTYFAGTTFTSTTLNNNDQLTVNYTIWIA